jgi:hypothetical protein
MATDPVHYDESEKAWFFYEEDWSHRQGPYTTEAQAREAITRYATEFLSERIADPEEECV